MPGTIGVKIAKQSYALPKPPKLETHSANFSSPNDQSQSTVVKHASQSALSQSIQPTTSGNAVATDIMVENNHANRSPVTSANIAN
ncbi:MAG TPA: hypothetical protein ACHBX0_03755 [Arsenophonus sp.]